LERLEMLAEFWFGNVKGRVYFRDPELYGSVLLE
jgi:hypothetical protein